jgi:hypothetical protein
MADPMTQRATESAALERPKPPRRSSERGATLFVVVLAVTLLTGVGLYTVHSAALSERAAGGGRQALQARGVTEVHAIAALSKFRREVESDIMVANDSIDPNYSGMQVPCESNMGLAGIRCRALEPQDLAPPTGAALLAPDSLGALGTTRGVARIDLTDLYPADIPTPGNQEGRGAPTRMYTGTMTVVGQLNPAGTGNVACVQNMMQVSGQHIIRAHLLLGPI